MTLAVTSVVVFGVLEWLPGNAAQVILGETATPESLAAMEEKLGLNQPALSRYLQWTGGLLQGQSGMSISYDTPTADLMLERMHVTLPLAVMAMSITVLMALCLGLYAASKQNSAGECPHALCSAHLQRKRGRTGDFSIVLYFCFGHILWSKR